MVEKAASGKQVFFGDLQVRSHFNSNTKTTERCNTVLLNILIEAYKSNLNSKLISQIYSCLQSRDGISTLYIKSMWERGAKISTKRIG